MDRQRNWADGTKFATFLRDEFPVGPSCQCRALLLRCKIVAANDLAAAFNIMTAQLKAEFEGPHHEWWLRPSDASLVPLMLQSSEEPQLMPKTLRWSRIGKPSSRVSPLLRASYWVGSSLLVPGTRKYDLSIRSGALAALKLLIAWPIFCLLV